MGTFQPPAECQDGKSVILSATKGDPANLDRSFLIANAVALEREVYTSAEATEVLLEIKSALATNVTYLSLLKYVNDVAEETQRRTTVAAIIIGADVQRIAQAGGGMFITKCDKALLNAHLDKQIGIVGMY